MAMFRELVYNAEDKRQRRKENLYTAGKRRQQNRVRRTIGANIPKAHDDIQWQKGDVLASEGDGTRTKNDM